MTRLQPMTLTACVALALGAACTAPLGQAGADTPAAAQSDEPINDRCPLTGKPVVGRNLVDYKGHKIGFCSNRCEAAWNNWGKAKRDAFVAKYK